MGDYTKPTVEQPDAAIRAKQVEAAGVIGSSRTSSTATGSRSLINALDIDTKIMWGDLPYTYSQMAANDPITNVRIGITPLVVPPTQINVVEDKYNDEIPVLRGRGAALVKTGRGHIRINMPLDFPDADSINGSLRELIAQFRVCPFTTLENYRVASIVSTGRLDRLSAATIQEAINKAEAAREKALTEYTAARQKVMDIVGEGFERAVRGYAYIGAPEGRFEATFGASRSTLLEQLVGYSADELKGWCLGTFAKGMYSLPFGGVTGARSYLDLDNLLKERVQKMLQAHEALITKIRELVEVSVSQSLTAPIVPVAFRQIVCQTVPGSVDRIQAHLEMWYFNSQAYMPSLLFVGRNGAPVNDITQCEVYRDHVNRYLDASGIRSYNDQVMISPISEYQSLSDLLLLEYPTPVMEEVPSAKQQPSITRGIQATNTAGPVQYRPKTKSLTTTSARKEIILKNVAVSLENNLAPQPIEGALYGTLQYMGTTNAKVKVTLALVADSEDALLGLMTEVQDIKTQTDAVSQTLGQKARRNARIRIENPLVNMFGVHNVLLDRVETRTAGPFAAEVDLFFTEYTTSIEKRERILYAVDNSDKIYREVLWYLVNIVTAYYHGKGSEEAMKAVNGGLSLDAIAWATTLLYRDGPNAGVITQDVMLAAIKNSRLSGDINAAFTSTRRDTVKEALAAAKALEDEARTKGEALARTAKGRRKGLIVSAHLALARKRGKELVRQAQSTSPLIRRDATLDSLADRYLKVWSGAQKSSTLAETEFNLTIPETPDRGLVDNIINNISSKPQFTANFRKLRDNIYAARALFSHINTLIQEYRNESVGNVYPDLQLPDYFTAFKSIWGFIKDKTGVDVSSYEDPNSLPTSIKRACTAFIPTYNDLGIIPAAGKQATDFARKLDDPVEPDFYFFWAKTKFLPEIQAALDHARKSLDSAPGTDKADPTEADKSYADIKRRANGRVGANNAMPTNDYPYDPAGRGTIPNGSPTKVITEAGEEIKVKAEGGSAELRYVPADSRAAEMLGLLNPDDRKHREALLQAVYDEMPDRYRRMITAFPAFKVSLIETDGEVIGYYDDWYGYNSIKSIRIHSHKITPKIAEIEIVNITGNLDQMRSLSSDQERDEYESSLKSGTAENGTNERIDIGHFFLEAGTPIVIKLGYSPIESELTTKFEGQIVSINAGDIIRIVAQGYGAELTKPINLLIDGRNPYFIVKEIMDASGTPHYGDVLYSLDSAARNNLRINPFTGDQITPEIVAGFSQGTAMLAPNAISRAIGTSRASEEAILAGEINGYLRSWQRWAVKAWNEVPWNWNKIVGDMIATRKMLNVYLPKEKHLSGMLSAGAGKAWGIPNIDGISALHELTRYMPGFICATRPYGRNNVTLFFGKPEQPYFYTDMKQDEEAEWLKVKRNAELAAKAKVEELYSKFISSELGQIFINLVIARRETSRSTSARVIMSTIKELVAIPAYLGRIASLGSIRQVERLTEWGISFNYEKWLKSWVEAPDAYRLVNFESRSQELATIRDKVHSDGLRTIASLFFATHNNSNTWDGMRISKSANNTMRVIRRGWEYIQNGLFAPGPIIYDIATYNDPVAPNAGVMMYWYSGWEHTIDVISGAIGKPGPKTVPEEIVRNMVQDAFPEYKQEGTTIAMVNGKAMAPEFFNGRVRDVIDWIPEWKWFLGFFAAFLQEEDSQELINATYEAHRQARGLQINPRMRRFRKHHFVSSHSDIIKNDIQASREFMANHVIVSYPDSVRMKKQGEEFVAYVGAGKEKTVMLGFSDDIDPSEHVMRVVNEHNAVCEYQAKICAKSNLAEAMRPMYRGELMLRGHERIEPYDIVWVNDWYNDIFGPIEVEAVIDHLDESGYQVTVVPQMVVTNNSSSGWADLFAVSSFWGEAGRVALGGILGGIAGGVLTGANPLGIAAGAVAGGSAAASLRDNHLRQETGKGLDDHLKDKLVSMIVGQSMYNAGDPGIRIVALLRNGRPWTSGLRGIGTGGWVARVHERLKYIYAGWVAVGGPKYTGSGLVTYGLDQALEATRSGTDK